MAQAATLEKHEQLKASNKLLNDSDLKVAQSTEEQLKKEWATLAHTDDQPSQLQAQVL